MRKGVAPLTYVLFFSLCVLSLSSAEIDTVNSTVQRVAYDGSSDPDNKDVSVHQVTYGGKKYPDIVVSQIVGIDTLKPLILIDSKISLQSRCESEFRISSRTQSLCSVNLNPSDESAFLKSSITFG